MTTLPDAELMRRLVEIDSTSRNSNLPIAELICEGRELVEMVWAGSPMRRPLAWACADT